MSAQPVRETPRDWATVVLSSFAPSGEGTLVGDVAVDFAGTWARFVGAMNARAQFGARIALLIGITAPIWALGRLTSLARLPAEDRARALDKMLSHRIYLFRELTLMLKVCACLAMFGNTTVRERTNYDGPQAEKLAAKTRLPVAASATEAA